MTRINHEMLCFHHMDIGNHVFWFNNRGNTASGLTTTAKTNALCFPIITNSLFLRGIVGSSNDSVLLLRLNSIHIFVKPVLSSQDKLLPTL